MQNEGSSMSRWRWLALAVLGAVGVCLWLFLGSSSVPPQSVVPPAFRAEVVFAAGDVGVRETTQPQQPTATTSSSPLMALAPGNVVWVGVGRACLLVDSGVSLCLGAGSRLRVEALNVQAQAFVLERGEVVVWLPASSETTGLELRSGETTIRSLGSAFALRRRDDSLVEVDVLQGQVRVQHATANMDVGAGNRLRWARENPKPDVLRLARVEEGRHWQQLAARDLWQGLVVGRLRVSAAVGVTRLAQVSIDGQQVGALPLAILISAGRHDIQIHDEQGYVRDAQKVNVEAGAEALVHLQWRALPSTAFDAGASSPGPILDAARAVTDDQVQARELSAQVSVQNASPSVLLNQAGEAMAAGDLKRAQGRYQYLMARHPNAPEAGTARISLGQLHLRRADGAPSALSHFDFYLKGGGPLAEEAFDGKANALQLMGQPQEEKSALETALAQFPRSTHARKWRQRLKSLGAARPGTSPQ